MSFRKITLHKQAPPKKTFAGKSLKANNKRLHTKSGVKVNTKTYKVK